MLKIGVEDSRKQEEYAREKTRKDIYDAMQSLEYEVNTLFTSNGQTPFVTFGFGLGRTELEREIQKAILKLVLKVWVRRIEQQFFQSWYLLLNAV